MFEDDSNFLHQKSFCQDETSEQRRSMKKNKGDYEVVSISQERKNMWFDYIEKQKNLINEI